MDTLIIFFSNSILFQFLGAVISIFLTVTIIYIKREIDRSSRRNYYQGVNQNGGILGDIDIKINEELPSESFTKLLTMWGLQPLLLLLIISFIDNHNNQFKILWFSSLLIFTLLHEFLTGLKYSNKRGYQLLMLMVWLITFFVLSYEKNFSENLIEKNKTTEQHTITQLPPLALASRS